MTAYFAVFDTAAVDAYINGVIRIGRMLAGASKNDQRVIVPVLCFADAHRRATPDQALMLDLLQAQPAVHITPVLADDAVMVGGWSRRLGTFDAAQAALEAATHRLPIITDRRETLTQILAKEWPIIDL
ncbi:hypothetical protein SAMN05421812_1206 [Asanoa hainanensis]|uniref:PIN domain-containing protein n=1 Tax=Asanoa hainanensis TaxID=560556 RepID=A0A239PEN1_9ACTN|nr:hypothetical protein [Asanoa hainanensis]SNT65084.1 hypothetical protein SAMN05421812_1206 [Asanoa hainanensis]